MNNDDMKRKGFLQTAFTLTAALLLLAGCTQDELADKQGETLPEGKYPMTFTATGLQAMPMSRATADGTWETNDKIAIKVENDTRQYFVKTGGSNTATLEVSSGETPFDWQNTNDITVSAFYLGYRFQSTLPQIWYVQSDQSDQGYQWSDFLYAYDEIYFPTKDGNKTLHFFHQTAKVVVHIIKGDQTPSDIADGSKTITMTIGDPNSSPGIVSLAAKWLAPSTPWRKWPLEGVFGDWGQSDSYGTITPKSLGAILVNDESVKSIASYEALVIPQNISADNRLFKIEIVGYSPFYYTVPAEGIEWKAGTEHTYYITIEGSKLSVTASSSIGWKDGASGSGSVTLLKTIDLSQVNDKITIGDGAYRLKGNGQEIQHPIIVNGNADITFENEVKIKVNGDDGNTKGSVAMKIADDKKVKLTVKGTGHSLTSTSTNGDYGCGIELGNRASIEIIGEGITNSSLTVKAGSRNSGIGPKSHTSCECEGITIKDIDLTVQTDEPKSGYTSFGAAIGLNITFNSTQFLKFIHIENAKITAVGHGSGTCIGTGPLNYGNINIDEIKIENSILVLKVEKQWESESKVTYLQGACIGFGAAVNNPNNYSHTIGSIIITNTTFDESCSGYHIVGSGFENAWTFLFTTSINNGNGFTVNGTTCKTSWDSASSHD